MTRKRPVTRNWLIVCSLETLRQEVRQPPLKTTLSVLKFPLCLMQILLTHSFGGMNQQKILINWNKIKRLENRLLISSRYTHRLGDQHLRKR